MIYVICFSLSVFLAYVAKRSKSRSNFILFSILSILVTALLAGLRGISVGIDTANYYYGSWARAVASNSISDYFEIYFRYSSERVEILHALYISAIAKWTGNFHLFLFGMHLVIISGVYIGAFRMREHADPVLTLTLFYLLYYNHSLNITKQYVAMAILFAAAADLEKGKTQRYLFFVAIAFLVHNSGILGLLPFFIYTVLYPKKGVGEVPLRRRVLIGVLIVALFYGFIPLTQLLLGRGILSRHYAAYFLDTEGAIPKIVVLLLILEAVVLFFWWKNLRRYDKHGDFFIFCSVAFILIYQLATAISYGKRIAAYLSFLNIVTLGMLPESHKHIFKNEHVIRTGILLAALIYWLFFYVYKNYSRTFPYVLGIG